MAERFMKSILLFTVSISVTFSVDGQTTQVEPTCYSKFDYDYKLLKKVTELEKELSVVRGQLTEQTGTINVLQKELHDFAGKKWEDWTEWSPCVYNCSGPNKGRTQTRSRTSKTFSDGTEKKSESESRPCNAVQFAGCVQQYGADDNFGVTYDFADQVALSTCASLPEAKGHVFAVRRQCSNLAVSCDETCKSLSLTCFNSLHVYRGSPALGRDETGKKGLYLYRYNGCGGSFCGPNFCCCQ